MSRLGALFASKRALALMLGATAVAGGGHAVQSQLRWGQEVRDRTELEGRFSEVSGRAGRLSGELEVERAALARAEAGAARVRERLSERERALAAAEAQGAALAVSLGEVRAARARAAEALRASEVALSEARAEVEGLRGSLAGLQGSLEGARAELEQARQRLAAAEREAARQGEAARLAQAKAEAAAGEQSRAEAQASRLAGEVATLRESLEESQRLAAGARAALRQEQGLRVEAERSAAESAALLGRERRGRVEAEAALARAQAELVAKERLLQGQRARAEAAEGSLSKVRAAGINVERLTGERPLPDLQAVVVRVDESAVPPRVVIDAGEGQGLLPGDVLHVVRDGRSVGRIELDSVQAGLASARLIEGRRGLVLRPGDLVRTSVPKP